MGDRVNLVFYVYQKQHDHGDFREIARRVMRREPRIAAHVCATSDPIGKLALFPRVMLRPTLSIEMDRMRWPRSPRGPRLAHRPSGGKLKQYELLTKAGIPVPRMTAVTPDLVLDPTEWGPYVVVKPDRGRRGAFVTVRKPGKVRYQDPESFAPDHLGRKGGMVAQQFIYTGPQPQAYRVLTYFGRAVNCTLSTGRADLPALEGPDGFRKAGGVSIVASAMGSTFVLADDADVIALAQQVHAVVPDIPSLGVDIIRDARTGQLFVLEINPSGNCWRLSSPNGRKIQAENKIDLYSQFDALEVVAARSVELALEQAR